MNPDHLALYVHVPFCQARCTYCDFNTYAGLDELIPAYVSAVCREIELAGRDYDSPIARSIYLGGGTPSLLSPASISDILTALTTAFDLAEDAEVTIEVNPGTVDLDYLRAVATLGFNRISLGAQSAHDAELDLLGRIHTWKEVGEAVESAGDAGFSNLNLDFIYGLPGQTESSWRNTLEQALEFSPTHFSLYSLTLEEGTSLAAQITRGDLPAPDGDQAAQHYELAESLLARAGYFHYEISNWALRDPLYAAQKNPPEPWNPIKLPDAPVSTSIDPSRRMWSEDYSRYVSRHNLVYWRNGEYLGFGAGATSRLGRRRWTNRGSPAEYIDLVGDSRLTEEEEVIERRQEMGETMMLSLRLAEGVHERTFHTRFDAGLQETYPTQLSELSASNLLSWDGYTARLTARGRLLGNQVFARFV